MSKPKHTPGPWFIKPTPSGTFGRGWKEISPSVVTCAEYHSSRDGVVCGVQMSDANAHLISAAPDMLEALLLAESAMNHMGDALNGMDAVIDEDQEHFQAFEKVRAAIAKAKGEA